MLCCILDRTAGRPQISARIVEPEGLVRHWLKTLHALSLVQRIGTPGDGEPLYAATLDNHPDWVRAVIARHRH